MAISELKKVNTEDADLGKVQDNIKFVFSQMNKDILDGVFLKEIKNASGSMVPIVINTTTTMIPHGLNRDYLGWQILDIQGNATVWRDATVDTTKSANAKNLFLPLRASSQVTVCLWVF